METVCEKQEELKGLSSINANKRKKKIKCTNCCKLVYKPALTQLSHRPFFDKSGRKILFEL